MDAFFAYTLFFLLTLLCSSIFFFFFFFFFNKQTRKPLPSTAQLPPGSMGWPYIGETLQLYSQNPNAFFAAKQRRYGEIFKTNILGCPCVMLASPEAARFVLVTHAHLFKPTYPKSKERLIGPHALFFHQGHHHTRLRKLVQASLSPDSLRKLMPHIETLAVSAMDSWAHSSLVNTFSEMKRFSFEVGILTVFGHLEPSLKEEINKNYRLVDRGYNSFPTSLPGTPFKKALLARKRLDKIIRDIIRERKEKKFLERDLLGYLLGWNGENGEVLSDEEISDNIIGVLFAAQDTTASVMTWIIKYLYDEPKLLEAVTAEQKAIRRSNHEGKLPLSWNQTKSMQVTHKVVLESLRMASIISFAFREAVADVEYKGFLIPKGWKAMPLFRNIHHNPDFFPEPQKLNPSRFEVAPKPNTFVPFGSGVHACPGNQLAKLEMLIMIHHLVTKFRWEVVGSQCGIQYGPFPVPVNGLPARFWSESTS